MTILETQRLSLCHIEKEHAPFLLNLLNTPNYHKYIGDRNVRSIADAEAYIMNGPVKSYERFGFGFYIVNLKEENTPIGMCGLVKRDTMKDTDIGFAFLPEHEGKGYGFESALAVMQWAKKQFNLKALAGIVLEDNPASIRLLEKLGLKFKEKFMMDQEELMLYRIDF